jgi:hypothetical protein
MTNPAVDAAAYRANLAFVEAMQREVKYEYTSKARLRQIAATTLMTLQAGYEHAVELAEAAVAVEQADSGLIVQP